MRWLQLLRHGRSIVVESTHPQRHRLRDPAQRRLESNNSRRRTRLTNPPRNFEAGNAITLDEVLLIGGDGTTKIGAPVVEGASVSARVDTHFRGEKLVIFKYKAKKRYRRRTGHRQEQTRLTITGISG